MPTTRRPSGITVTAPSTYAIADEPPKPGRRRARTLPPVPPSPLEDELISALEGLELAHLDTVPLTPTKSPSDPVVRRRAGAAAIPSRQSVDFSIELGPDEYAVALVEQDGILTWRSGTVTETASKPRRRGEPVPPPRRTAQFTIDVHASSSKARRSRGFADVVFRPVKALFFKFTAKVVLGQVVKRLEAGIDRGLVHISGADPGGWAKLDDATGLELPQDRPARVLLMVHGTFSSTVGGFGSLGATDWGRAFLDEALLSYDAILGFDHPTLSVDPLENAEELLAALRTLPTSYLPRIDAVCHSRGGLVYRSLVEHLLPANDWKPKFGRAVFVGATNGGTELADSDNWSRLIDLYTNLAVASLKGLSMAAPPTGTITAILGGVLKGVAALVKALAVATIDEGQVPGLAAMSPHGAFVADINETQPGQPAPGAIDNFAVISNFEPDLAGSSALPAKLKQMLTDGLVDQLLGEDNDLVVNTAAMTAIDPHVGGWVADVLDFQTNGTVHHTNYFHQPGTAAALQRWLQVDLPAAALVSGVPDLPVGGRVVGTLPSPVADDFVLVDSTMESDDAARLVDAVSAEFVVVRRAEATDVYHYAVRRDEFQGMIGAGHTVHESLDLHEWSASRPVDIGDAFRFEEASPDFTYRPSSGRGVVIADGDPVGVLPNELEMVAPELETTMPEPVAAEPPQPTSRPFGFGRRRGAAREPVAANGGGGTIPEPEKARHFFRGQMPAEVVVRKPATVEVTMSREELEVAAGRVGGTSGIVVDTERKIIIQVIPRANFELVDDASVDTPGRVELDALPLGASAIDLYFDVKALHTGEGHLDVVVRQGQVPLTTLELRPKIVRKRSGGPARLTVAEGAVTDAPATEAPLHQLSIHEEEQAGKHRLRFRFESPQLNILNEGVTDWLPKGSIADYVAATYAEIEEFWAQDQGDADAFLLHLQAVGMKMFTDLVPDVIRKKLWAKRKQLDSIQVLSTEPHIPWELVHLTKPDGSAPPGEWFFGQLGLVRWMWNLPTGYPKTEIRIDKAVAIVPEYAAGSGYELAAPAAEYSFVNKLFSATKVDPPEFKDVLDVLKTPGSFDLLHYAGHGVADPGSADRAKLVLKVIQQDGEWKARSLAAVDVEKYANLMHEGRAPVVVLNACQVGRLGHDLGGIGGFAQAFLSRGAGVFVGSLWSVGDEPALQFVETFYNHLAKGKTMAQATIAAREAARNGGDTTWLAYTVYANPHARLVT